MKSKNIAACAVLRIIINYAELTKVPHDFIDSRCKWFLQMNVLSKTALFALSLWKLISSQKSICLDDSQADTYSVLISGKLEAITWWQ